ncbi:MAG: hypothetical protein GSR80_000758 [Desulfurococcales archaeon]|nr:hypothetical protein [Desulfurococcales archaeon]
MGIPGGSDNACSEGSLTLEPNTHHLTLTLDPTQNNQGTLLLTLLTPASGGLSYTLLTINLKPQTLTPEILTQALRGALQAETPTQALQALQENLLEALTPNGDARGALRLCLEKHHQLPVRLTQTQRLEEALERLALEYDAGTGPFSREGFALCLYKLEEKNKRGLLGGTKTETVIEPLLLGKACLGKYIDEQVLDKVLSAKTISIFLGSCTLATTLCESGRTLGIGTLWGLLDSALVCGIPASVSYWARGTIAQRIKETGKATLTWPQRAALYGGTATGLTLAKLARYRAFSEAYAILKGGIAGLLAKKDVLAKLRRLAPKLAETLKGANDRILAGLAYIANTNPTALQTLNTSAQKGTLEKDELEGALDKIADKIKEGKNPDPIVKKLLEQTTAPKGQTGGTTEKPTPTEAAEETPKETPAEAPEEEGLTKEKLKELGKGLGCPLAGLLAGTVAANLYTGDTIFGGLNIQKLTITLETNTLRIENTLIGG